VRLGRHGQYLARHVQSRHLLAEAHIKDSNVGYQGLEGLDRLGRRLCLADDFHPETSQRHRKSAHHHRMIVSQQYSDLIHSIPRF